MAGLTTTGFVTQTLPEIIDDINQAMWAAFTTTLDLSGFTPWGQLIGIMAERLAVLWELAEAIYASQDPDAASAAALEQIAALTGTTREPARPSTTTLTLTGTPTTVVSEGSRAATAAGDEFATDEDATIATLTAWANSTAYALGARRTNASRAYVVITAGTSAGSGGPTTTAADITDGTVHWRYLGEGTGAVDVDATCTETGPTSANSGLIVEIVTPVAGWSSVVNLLDADLGSDEETDEDLRERREEEIANPGTSPVDAIRADVARVPGVVSVTVFENDTAATVDSMPPHSVEVLVRGGEDQALFDAMLAAVAGGIQPYGSTTGTTTDDEGNVHDVAFTRPDEIEIYVTMVVQVDAQAYPLDGNDQIEAAIVAWGDALRTGYNVHSSAVSAQAFKIAGVLNVTTCNIGTAPSPGSSASISIGQRELATFDTSRIGVTANPVTP